MENAADYLEVAMHWPTGQEKGSSGVFNVLQLQRLIYYKQRNPERHQKRKFTLWNDCHTFKAFVPRLLPPTVEISNYRQDTIAVKHKNEQHENVSLLPRKIDSDISSSKETDTEWKPQWCVSMATTSTSSVVSSNLSQEYSLAKEKLGNVSKWTRGKWIISCSKAGKYTAKEFWPRLCELLSEGSFPNCKAVIKEEDKKTIVWLYCDFWQAEEVYTLLRRTFKDLPKMTYSVHPYGAIINK
ncbi:hypothetical protein TrispH2_010868 [Trichoplax sp. H2]|nr:hypothetical protein TrispH2_010868 [Trichoplax sp. H2]|eukprot:RDD36804.1 hypothetical protein TrispH2_010868 [Trichoplax sp. H2]